MRAGDRLSEGPVNPHDILRIKGPRAVQEYLLNEVQEVYRLQGVKINDKHIGVIVQADAAEGAHRGFAATPSSSKVSMSTRASSATENDVAKKARRRRPRPSRCCSASRRRRSPRSRSSRRRRFQETTRVLTDAAIRGSRDDLLGLKENIIIGHLIPAGTGMYRYHDVDVESDALPEPEPIPEALEPNFEALLPSAFAESVPFTMGDVE